MQIVEPRTETFGKYQIVERLSVGPIAEVYKAKLDGLGGFQRTFAIKRILPEHTARPEFLHALVDEAKLAGLLSHANIVQILDLGEVNGSYFVAMEYVDGSDLDRILTRCREKGITLPVPHAVFLTIEILKALEYAHHRQVMRGGKPVPLDIVHKDVSPSNVLVSNQGEVKLTDFGIARAARRIQESAPPEGFYDYMSPEQLEGRADRRSDLFATGALLYEVLTGQHPFARATSEQTIEAIRRGLSASPSDVNPDVPSQLEAIVDRALSHDPADRYPDATAMKEALDRFFHDSGFIFSHSTLAAFIKGLFPPGDEGDRNARTRRTMTVPLRDDDVERPTTAAPRSTALSSGASTMLRNVRDYQTGTFAGHRGEPSNPGHSSEETFIRPAPGPNSDTAIDGPRAWSDAETVIKPSAALSGPAPVPRYGPPGGWAPPDGQSTDSGASSAGHSGVSHSGVSHSGAAQTQKYARPDLRPETRSEPRVEMRPEPRHEPRPPLPDIPSTRTVTGTTAAITPLRLKIVWLAFGVFMAAFLIVLGAVIYHNLLRITGMSASPSELAVRHEPELQIQVPSGAVVRLNDREIPGTGPFNVPLTAATEYVVRVEVPDYFPVETTLRLDYNDIRILSFQLEDMRQKKKTP